MYSRRELMRYAARLGLAAGGLALAAACDRFGAGAPLPGRVPRIGYLGSQRGRPVEAFLAGMRELGYVDGQTMMVLYRLASDDPRQVLELARELVTLEVDVLVTGGTAATRAARAATTSIPIVMATSAHPVESGLVSSLARPSANVTGLTASAGELSGRCLELLGEAVPRLRRVGVLLDATGGDLGPEAQELETAATLLQLAVVPLGLRGAGELEGIFERAVAEHVDGLVVLWEPDAPALRAAVVALAARHRLPTIYTRREFVTAGGLMSYGVSEEDLYRRAATYVARVLHGGDPGLLPVRRAMRFELVLNQNAATKLGLAFPEEILLDADDVLR